jgi:hypothetical protein
MIIHPRPFPRRSLECLSLPAVLLRAGVFALVLAFVLLLVRWGHSVETCLVLLAGSGMAAVQVATGMSRAPRAV